MVVQMVSDSDEEVRAAIAEQIHEVARLAGKDSVQLLIRPVVLLLRDSSPLVQVRGTR
jgi:hypothetical protein